MLRFLALPFLAVVLSAQAQPEMVVSVGHAGAPSHVAFAGAHLVTASSSNVALIDLSTGLTVAHLPQASLVDSIEANAAGDVLAVGACGHSIQLWDLKSRTPLRRIALEQECTESVSFSRHGWRSSSRTRVPSTSPSVQMGVGSRRVSKGLSRRSKSGRLPAPVMP
jgi:WD40 repeat protein